MQPPANDHTMDLCSEPTPIMLDPGKTLTFRSENATRKIRIAFDDGTEISTTILPNQAVELRRGSLMTPTVILDDAETTVRDPLRVVAPECPQQ